MIPYIINVGLILTGCLAFYKLLLHKETFYHLNRYVLIACLVISFSLPLLHLPEQLSFKKPTVVAININQTHAANNIRLNTIPIANNAVQEATSVQKTVNRFSWNQFIKWMFWLYWFGVIVFGFNFLIQIIALFYRAYSNSVVKDGKYRIVEIKGDKAPCSFFNNIFINPEQYEWDVYNQVLQHEKIHIHQRHSLDILLAELVLIFQWFNPFAWQYRKEIEYNLEFLTDSQMVLQHHVEKANYQISLLKVSAPHFPLRLTTNYNQSLLKKRIVMMNAKRSSVHSAWKYFFLFPLLILFASVLNEPVATARNTVIIKTEKHGAHADSSIQNEGYWFATIRGDKINLHFTQDENDHQNENNSEFLLSDFPNLPKNAKGDFKLTREAGTMNFKGKFDSNQGMGKYQFMPDATFGNFMSTQGISKIDDNDLMTFFFWNITKEYVQMLKDEGCTNIKKDKLIALKVFGIDKPFITSITENGVKDIQIDNLISFKEFGITGAYIKEIKDAGYKDISADQLITFKMQGIDKTHLSKLSKSNKSDSISTDDVLSLKTMNVDEAYANSFKAVGLKNIEPQTLITMKIMGVTSEYVKQFIAIGYKNVTTEQFISLKMNNLTPEYAKQLAAIDYKNIPPDQLLSMKTQGITPEFVKSLKEMGYDNVDIDELISLKVLDVQPEYIKSLKEMGYSNISLKNAIYLKMQNITADFLNGFAAVGFKNISIDDAIALKIHGVTSDWIKEMQKKGFKYNNINKYINLKILK